ncbi:hypothetical protein ACFU9Y_37895 [Streptomyces sp. NPDC057621]|uniref:hypothetical protein n=1 Tax=Streptomyces sp. NPDC057621 TaxID=3346186 RepID=UPI0036B344E5
MAFTSFHLHKGRIAVAKDVRTSPTTVAAWVLRNHGAKRCAERVVIWLRAR